MHRLEIIYEDNDIILCRKPAGVATQTKRFGQQDMESLLKNYRARKKEPPYIGVVHRLDQPVAGLMVFAKNQKAAAGLSKQIQQKMIGKNYYAISAGSPKESEGKLEDYLLTDKKTNVTSVVSESESTQHNGVTKKDVSRQAKKAILEYQVLEEKVGMTLFDIHLHTGRQHQIRVQMAHMGCPLVGDCKYGQRDLKSIEEEGYGLALCSYRLTFTHPATGKQMDFSIQPTGAAFGKFFDRNQLL